MILDFHQNRRSGPPVEQPGLTSATLEFQEHRWLHIYGYDSPLETDEVCQFKREAAHPGARFNHCHCQKVIKSISFSGVWKRNIRDLLHADG